LVPRPASARHDVALQRENNNEMPMIGNRNIALQHS
jgi:hypothetical protein